MTQVLANSFKIILNFNIHYFYNHKIHVLFTRTVSPFRIVHMFVWSVAAYSFVVPVKWHIGTAHLLPLFSFFFSVF